MSRGRHCERSEAIHLSLRGDMDCFVAKAPLRKRFAFAAGNDGRTSGPGIPALLTIAVFGADIRHPRGYINPARHVRAFGVRMEIINDGIDTIE
jgi:hypothetical protein